MNIFACSRNPRLAARALPDKHIVKMPLETAQMLSTVAHSISFGEKARSAKSQVVHLGPGSFLLYGPAFQHHPCTRWAGASAENASWLHEHGMALCAEYTRRYGKVHSSQAVLELLKELPSFLPSKGLLPFAQAMPEQYKQENHVLAYRSYLVHEKKHFARWRAPATPPKWWLPYL